MDQNHRKGRELMPNLPRRAAIVFLFLLATALLAPSRPAGAAGRPPKIGIAFAKALYDQGSAVFVDVRGEAAYRAEHIKGAILFPLEWLRAGKRPPLPKDQTLILYCGCPHSLSEEAAEILIADGYANVYVLDEGYYGWKDAGYPVTLGQKAQALRYMVVRGRTTAPPGTRVYAYEFASRQWEAGEVDAQGRYELHLPFYDVRPGTPITVEVVGARRTIPFQPGTTVTLDLR